MYSYETKEVNNGCDCWGRQEYTTAYIVKHNGNIIFKTQDNPKELIDYLNNVGGVKLGD